jgi:hypothetical protein
MKNRSTIILSLLFIASLSSAIYFYRQNQTLTKSTPQAQAEAQKAQAEEAVTLVQAISKLILLPDEAPTIATITDPELLKDQPFFAQTKAGDKVLLYSGAKKVILYDPKAGKILDVGSFNINKEAPAKPAPEEDEEESAATSTKSTDSEEN